MSNAQGRGIVTRWFKVMVGVFGCWLFTSMVLLERGGEGWLAEHWAWAWVPVALALVAGAIAQFHDAPRGPLSSPGGRLMAFIAVCLTIFLGLYDVALASQDAAKLGLSGLSGLFLMPLRRVQT